MIEKDLFETYSAATIAFIEVCMEKKENIIICIFKRKLKKIYGKCQRMEAVLFFECTFKKHEHNSLTGQARKRCQNPVKNPFQKGSYFNQKSGVSSPTYLLTYLLQVDQFASFARKLFINYFSYIHCQS